MTSRLTDDEDEEQLTPAFRPDVIVQGAEGALHAAALLGQLVVAVVLTGVQQRVVQEEAARRRTVGFEHARGFVAAALKTVTRKDVILSVAMACVYAALTGVPGETVVVVVVVDVVIVVVVITGIIIQHHYYQDHRRYRHRRRR